MSEADKVRGAIANAFEEVEMFDGMPREEASRHIAAFTSLADSTLVTLARHIKAIRRIDRD